MALVDIERSPGAPTRHCVTRWMRSRFSGACLLAVLCAVPGISVRSARDVAQGWRACALPAANGFRQQDAGPVRRLMVLRGGSSQERGGRASQDQRTSREHAAACAELQNAMLELGTLLSGAVLTEQIFSIPGFGKLIVDAVFNRDYAVVQGVVLTTATIYITLNLIADIAYILVNPRLRG